ncbi:sigma-70 family RNA polymerase sigma factor [Bacillus sp. HMF5848]|uniref:sigma-70 family RNA polymerase sigma factor n=1 Tax=Bacillus sp. HMF5848 TaxID=2495421 RepID=UPI00163AF9EC|nr:sigma-70 family RNA polymerase sigma factor [Bacillus sp. HMF5848]
MNIDRFDELAEQYKPLIYHILKKLAIYQNYDHYYQIGLIALWEAQRRYDPTKSSFTTFAYVTIKGKLQAELTKENRYYERSACLSDELMATLVDDENPFYSDEFDWILEHANLSHKQKTWVIKRLLQDKSHKQIAEEEGVTEDAVKSWRKSAIKKLRETFKQLDY